MSRRRAFGRTRIASGPSRRLCAVVVTVRCPRCDRLHVVDPLGAENAWMFTASDRPAVVGDALRPIGKILCGRTTIYVYERAG